MIKNNLFVWDYSEKSDILNIRKTGKKSVGGSELGDFTVDFDKDGSVIGIEIMNASEFFVQIEISKEQLINIKSAEIITQKRNSYTLIWLNLLLPNNVQKTVPLPTPIMAQTPMAGYA